jgi:hypothetical protein
MLTSNYYDSSIFKTTVSHFSEKMENTFAGGFMRLSYPAIVYDIKYTFYFSGRVYHNGN